jgi:hypothetical protein
MQTESTGNKEAVARALALENKTKTENAKQKGNI